MKVIEVRDPDDALAQGISYLLERGVRSDSRNGPVLVAPEPVTTVYTDPLNCVSLWDVRDANPFFHLVEAMWMLTGSNDVGFVAKYAASMRDFSDDGKVLWGAYGYRWRRHFDQDQLVKIIVDLTVNPSSRRAVLAMWDGAQDLTVAENGGRDVPCNTHAYFSVHDGKLNMTVCCRSNDIVWGAYGANVVHFSLLQQFMAEAIGVGIGVYYQMSNNYHAYIERPDVARLIEARRPDKYPGRERPPLAKMIVRDSMTEDDFLNDADGALRDPHGRTYKSPFVKYVLVPMITAHMLHKAGNTKLARDMLQDNAHQSLWFDAGAAWLTRRLIKNAESRATR